MKCRRCGEEGVMDSIGGWKHKPVQLKSRAGIDVFASGHRFVPETPPPRRRFAGQDVIDAERPDARDLEAS